MSKVRNKSYKAKKILLALVLSMAMSTNIANADIVHEKNTPLSLHNKISTLSRKFVKSKVKGAATGFATPYSRQVIEPGNTVSFDDVTFDGAFIKDTNAYGGAIFLLLMQFFKTTMRNLTVELPWVVRFTTQAQVL